jgi:hypothetical protein
MSEFTATDQALLDQYRGGVARVELALKNITDDELDRPMPEDEWTVRMVVHHLADSETRSYLRLRQLLVDPPPATIQGYDEELWATSDVLGYQSLPVEPSLEVFRAVRTATSVILGRISPADLDREGHHSESGAYSLRRWLELYAAHGDDHAQQIERARRGSPRREQGES